MPIAYVGRTQFGAAASDVTIATNATSHVQGHGLVALIDIQSGKAITGISSTADGSTGWTKLATYDEVNIFNEYEIWYHSNTAGHASDIVTATISPTSQFRTITVYEISGQDTTGMGDSSNSNFALTGTAISSGSVTVSTGDGIIFAIMAAISPPTTQGTGYTLANFGIGGGASYYSDEYHIVTASEAATATQNASNQWAILAGSFKAAPVLMGQVCL